MFLNGVYLSCLNFIYCHFTLFWITGPNMWNTQLYIDIHTHIQYSTCILPDEFGWGYGRILRTYHTWEQMVFKCVWSKWELMLKRKCVISLYSCPSFTRICIPELYSVPPEKGFTVREPGLHTYADHVGWDQELETQTQTKPKHFAW